MTMNDRSRTVPQPFLNRSAFRSSTVPRAWARVRGSRPVPSRVFSKLLFASFSLHGSRARRKFS